ncbi:hypothetical protein OUZ56_033906 [Daphnia magna]|uniref:Uncharacterized protein n=1 Tax=Daphnia magna TaxID=35525 RepID=A0ABR0BB84_9CRUS|nr:hypothetical protein OUZ56_033906 [Daphnia magna]
MALVKNPIFSATGSVNSRADHRNPNSSKEPSPKLPSVKKVGPVPKSMLTGDRTCDITEKTSKNPIISAAGSVTSLSDHRSPNTLQEPPPKLPSVWAKQPSLSLPIQTTSAKQQLFGPSCTVNAGEDQSLTLSFHELL